VRIGQARASLLLKMELQTMIASPQMTSAATTMMKQYLQKIGDTVETHAILKTCDETRITQRDYEAIFKKFKAGANSANKRLQLSCLPSPNSVQQL